MGFWWRRSRTARASGSFSGGVGFWFPAILSGLLVCRAAALQMLMLEYLSSGLLLLLECCSSSSANPFRSDCASFLNAPILYEQFVPSVETAVINFLRLDLQRTRVKLLLLLHRHTHTLSLSLSNALAPLERPASRSEMFPLPLASSLLPLPFRKACCSVSSTFLICQPPHFAVMCHFWIFMEPV